MPTYQEVQRRINRSLNECRDLPGQIFEAFVSSLVMCICMIFVIETYPIPQSLFDRLVQIEIAITIFFLFEYFVRWWAKDFSIKYIFTPMAMVDLIAIIPLFLNSHWQFVRLLRLFRIVRLFRVLQYQKFFFRSIREYHLRMVRILFTLLCLVFISAGLIFDTENPVNPDKIGNFFDALYFTVVTLATVGFGDVTPITVQGKVITMLMILSGAILIPWQIGDLIRSIILSASTQKNVDCPKCQLKFHDQDAKFCKSCGHSLEEQSGSYLYKT